MNRSTWLDAASSVLRHLATILSGLLTVGLVARALGAEGLGAWSLLGTVGYLVGLGDLGLSQGVGRAHAAGDAAGARAAAGRALWVALRAGPLLGAAAVGWVTLELRALSPSTPPGRLALCGLLVWAGGVAFAASMPLRALLVVRGAVRAASRARALGALAQAASLPAALALSADLAAPCLAFALSSSVEVWLLALALAPAPGERGLLASGAGRGWLWPSLREGAAALAINAAVALSLRVDVAILASVAPLGALASYGVALRAVDQSFGLVKQVGVALQPRMSTARGREEALSVGAALIPALAAAAALGLWFSGGPLLRLWAGPAASGEVFSVALGLLGAASVAAAFSEVASGWLAMAAPSPWGPASAIIAGCSVNLLISLAGRGPLGVWAVAAGTLVGNALAAAIGWNKATKLQGWGQRRSLAAMLPAAAAVAGGLAAGPVARGLSERGAWGALAGCALDAGAALGAALCVLALREREGAAVEAGGAP